MLGDLKSQERMNGSECVVIGCDDIHTASILCFDVLVPNRAFAFRHHFGTRHIRRIMDQHRRIEIAAAEHHRDVG